MVILAQTMFLWLKYEWIYKKYMSFKDFSSRNGLAWYNKPIILAIFKNFLIWLLHDIFLFNVTPKNLTEDFYFYYAFA